MGSNYSFFFFLGGALGWEGVKSCMFLTKANIETGASGIPLGLFATFKSPSDLYVVQFIAYC